MLLRCSECHHQLELHGKAIECPRCAELLELVPEVSQDPATLKQEWRERCASSDPRDQSGVWRFREFLPQYPAESVVSLLEGNNPVVRGAKTAGYAGLRNLWFKHLGWNPTGCFKDLGMTVGITEAKFVGARAVACASTGNTSGSLAAYAARAGVSARVYLPAGKVSSNKLAQALDFGAEVVEVQGSFDAALNTMLRASHDDIYFLNSINPFRIEGQKMAMFTLCEQFAWDPPDYVVLPGGNLGNTSAFGKAFAEMKATGLIARLPKLIVVQAEGANPFARLWRSNAKELQPVEHPETFATAIRIGNPRSWKKALRAVKETDGFVMDVSDEEIAEAKELIGRDGIGCEPASATTLAGLHKLSAQKAIDPEARVVSVLTGHALKDTDFIIKRHNNSNQELAAIEAN